MQREKGIKQTRIRQHLSTRYPGELERTIAVRGFLDSICSRHIDLDLGDSNLADKLCSNDESHYWQQLSEVLLANEMLELGIPLQPSHDGPDFLFEHEGRRIWVEVICPRPEGIPAEWLANGLRKAGNVPHQEILMRWTAAIKEKAEKLLGNTAKGIKGYLDKGIVDAKDAYVVAVNGRLLRGPHFASITGISQFPYAVEAAFSVGPLTVNIDRETMSATGSGHQHRPTIPKPNGAQIPAYTFLDPSFKAVSAIWAADIDESWVIGNMKALAVIHNPEATNPISAGLLPSFDEYVATPNGNEYVLNRHAGRLAKEK